MKALLLILLLAGCRWEDPPPAGINMPTLTCIPGYEFILNTDKGRIKVVCPESTTKTI